MTNYKIPIYYYSGKNPFKTSKLVVNENGTVSIPTGQKYHINGAQHTHLIADVTDYTPGAGSGDVVGPASAVDNQVVRFNLTTGKLIQTSLMTVDDNGKPNIPTGQTYDINGSPHTHAGGGGDVTGPASSLDNQIARYDSTTGKIIQTSLATIDDNGSPNIPTGQQYKINGSQHTHTPTEAGLSNVSNNAQVKKLAASVDNQVVRWDGTGGDTTQQCLLTVDDSGSPNIPTGQAYKINNVALAASDVGAAPSAKGVTNGDTHDHNGGDGAAIDHVNLSNKGTNTHAQIDTALTNAPRPYQYFRRTGTTRPRWYTMPLACTALGVSGALTSERFYAIPFVCPKDCTTDNLSINCTTLVAAGRVRLGIYEDSNGEPGSRLIDAGEADTSGTGVKTVACVQALTAGKLYWLVALSNSATHAFRAPALAGVVNVIGSDVALPTTHITHFYAAQTYGALPASFPTVTQGTGIVFPLIFVRLSA